MTMISSQFCRVDRRCAMERTVVPHSSFIFSISAWMRFSEVLSSAEVDLVQYQDAGVFEKDAGQRDTLALTAGEVGPPSASTN